MVGASLDQFHGFFQIRGEIRVCFSAHGLRVERRRTGDIQNHPGGKPFRQNLLQKIGLTPVGLEANLEAPLGQQADQLDELVFLPVGALGNIEAGNPAVQKVAAGHAAIKRAIGQQPGQHHAGALKNHIPFRFMKHGKFHAFGVAVQTRAVVAVKFVDDFLVVGEVKLSVGDAVRLQIGFDDIAAQTVGRLVQNDVH